jgi:hypothetical protein
MGSYYKTYKGKKLGPYNYPRPIHLFTDKDVARIAKAVADREGGNAGLKIFAGIALALGFGGLFCKVSRSIASVLTVTVFFEKIAIILGAGQLVTLLITKLMQAQIVAPMNVRIVMAVAISALALLDKIYKILPSITGDLAILREVTGTLQDICKAVRELSGEAFDETCDALGSECQTLRDTGSEIAYQLKSDVDKAYEIFDLP